jgi:hypothetical protein
LKGFDMRENPLGSQRSIAHKESNSNEVPNSEAASCKFITNLGITGRADYVLCLPVLIIQEARSSSG